VKKNKKKSMPTIWYIPDDLWEEFKQVLPPEKPSGTVGRPARPFRDVLNGILYVLRTGCQWKQVPRKEFASGSVSVDRIVPRWECALLMDLFALTSVLEACASPPQA
jgi:transposase